MAGLSGLTADFSGIKTLAIGSGYPKLPFQNQKPTTYKFSKFHSENIFVSRKNSNIQIQCFHRRCFRATHILSAGRNYQLSNNDDSHTDDPFWLNMMRDAIWSVRDLLQFLVEQPGQLKYIEWPTFQSTLKTAVLTLVLVAVLIVALSSVDSALSYLLALFLRRKA